MEGIGGERIGGCLISPQSGKNLASIRCLFGTTSALPSSTRGAPGNTGARGQDSTEEHHMAKRNDDRSQADGIQKDPDEWVTGDESMTGPQASYLKTLANEAGEEVDENLTKAEASKKIDELQERTGRGRDH